MFVIEWLPVVSIATVFCIVGVVLACVEVAERRRERRLAALCGRRRGFRPVVINGGRKDAPAGAAPADTEKLAG